MPKSRPPLKKHTLLLFDGDWERLAYLFPEVDTSVVIRKLVRQFIDKHEAGEVALPEMKVDL